MSSIILPRADMPVMDDKGQFRREWYKTLTGVSQALNGVVNGQSIYSDSGVVNAIAITSGITSYSTGLTRYFVPAFTNTSTSVTLSDSGVTAKPVKFPDGSLPAVGQIVAGVTLEVIYNGTYWEIQTLNSANQAIPGNLSVGGTLSVTGIASLANSSTVAGNQIGFRGFPQNKQNAAYTTVLTDAGKSIYHDDGVAYTWTIDSNANVAYAIGTEIDFVCKATGAFNITLAITADTLVWLPTGGTGSRTLGQYARARALKVASTIWVLDGVGIT